MTQISSVTFNAACAISDDMVYVASSLDNFDDNQQFSRLFMYDYTEENGGGWYYHDVNFIVVDVCFYNVENNNKLIALSDEGEIEEFDGEVSNFKNIDGAGLNQEWSKDRGYLSTIKFQNNKLFACGYDGQVYINEFKWFDLSNGLKSSNNQILDFESLENEDDISVIDICEISGNYFCVGRIGDNGLIANYDGKRWNILKKVTPATLYSIIPKKDGKLIACGTYGNLIEINQDTTLNRKTNLSIKDDFYSLTEFNDILYIGSACGLYKFYENEITKVNIHEEIDNNLVFKVDSTENTLWIFTNKLIGRYDGNFWKIFDHPDNKEYKKISLTVSANEKCPKTGYWYTVAKPNSRAYFKQGDAFPQLVTDWGEVYWSWDGEN
ncbi:hypothetical protein ACG59Z_10425 [Acinetobacter sp. ABJ_C1_1]|uniref:hypothetical protein n=1 Tax=Acinetobacter sp. ABJ_C1_1 TaxID=3378321 RepID=UPI0037DD8C35